MRSIYKCEVCGSNNLVDVLDLGMHPMCDDLIPIGNKSICNEYPIQISYCNTCDTAHQKWQIEKEILFPRSYHYRARMTGSVLKFMRGFVESIDKYSKIEKDDLVIDIGCNDGSLLSIFSEKGTKTIGIDPTEAIFDAEKAGHQIIHGFFGHDIADILKKENTVADYITFTNVFAHIEDLKSLCESLNKISNEETLIVIENHYMGSILEKNQFDTFYHEHPRTYSANSFRYIAKQLEKELLFIEFPERYGGNIRVFIGNRNFHPNFPEFKLPDARNFFQEIKSMQNKVESWQKNCLTLIDKLIIENDNKPIPAKAFPGRAAILMRLLNIDEKKISAVYEIKGSIKTGNYVPSTRIPILPEKELYESKYNGPILNLAWHLSKEVRQNLSNNNFQGKVFDVFSEELLNK